MSTLERLNEQLAELENWTDTLERLEEFEDDPYWAWDQSQFLIREIEQDTDLDAWEQRLSPQERANTSLPPNYAYTHLVLLPFLRTYFDSVDEDREVEEERLEDEHPSALFWLATTLGITSTPTIEGQRALGWYVADDAREDDWEDEDEDEDDWEDEDEDEDEDDDGAQTIALSIEGFYTRLNRLCALSPALNLQKLSLSCNEFREDLVQRLDALPSMMLPKLKELTIELIDGNTNHLRELLNWSADQPELESMELHLRALSSDHTIDRVASPKHLTILYESHSEQRALYQLLASPLLARVEDLQIFEQMTWKPEEERLPALKQDELLPALAPHLPSTLVELFLSYNQAIHLDLNTLAMLDAPTLKRLTINLASFQPGSLENLLNSSIVSELEVLTFTNNELRNEDAELIASSAPATLTHLSLDRNLLTQEGAVALATSPKLQGLEYFSMYGALLYIESAQHLYEQFRDQANRSHEDRFGELRSLLQSPPDEESWEQLCTTLDAWPDMEQLEQEVIPYVLSYTEKWPSELCELPERWIWRAKEGLQAPMLKLVTMVNYSWTDGLDAEERAHIIGNHPHLNRLRSLVLDYTHINAETLQELARSPNVQHITTLSLADYWQDGDATQRVFLSAPLPALKQLKLNGYGLDEAFPQMLQAPYIDQLNTLELSDAELEREQLKALIKTGLLKQLERLALTQCELELSALKPLLSAPAPQLKHLDLSANNLNTSALVAILKSELGLQLSSLGFAYNSIDEGNAFTKLKDAPLNLEQLDLSCTNIPTRALKALGQCTWMKNIKVLNLSGNELHDTTDLKALLKSPHLGNLEQLILKGNYLSEEDYEYIHNAMTLPKVVRDQFQAELWDEDDYMEDIYE